MWIERLVSDPLTHGVELAARFAEQRHKLLAENVANLDTPDFQPQRLDPQAFQAALRTAFERVKRGDTDRLQLRGDAQVSTTADGKLRLRPAREPAQNLLFHDGTNARLETLMTDAQQNALSYRLALQLLRGRFNTMTAAIRGRTQ